VVGVVDGGKVGDWRMLVRKKEFLAIFCTAKCAVVHIWEVVVCTIVLFGGRVLTDEKSGQICFGPFSIQPIILLIFVLTFLLLEWLLSENTVVGNLVGRSGRFLAKTHLRYLEVCKR